MKNAFAQAMDMTPERCEELKETMFEFIEQEDNRPSDVLRKIADAEGFTQLERLTAEISEAREDIHKVELQKEELEQALEQLKETE